MSAIALVDRLAGAARGSGRGNSPPYRAVAQGDFRLDGRSAARIPDAPRDKGSDDGFAHRALPQASATSIRRRGGSAISGAAHWRTATRSLSRVRYSTGDFPSTLARNKAGSKRGRARFEAVRALPIDASEISARKRRKGGVVARPVGALARALEQKMIETEGKIESGIAEPGAFGVEEHRSGRALQRMFFGLTSP